MRHLLLLLAVFGLTTNALLASEYSLSLSTDRAYFLSSEIVTIKIDDNIPSEGKFWDTYLYFKTAGGNAIYITYDSNTIEPTPLQMLPREIQLRPVHWQKTETVELHLVLCEGDDSIVFARAQMSLEVVHDGSAVEAGALPQMAQLQFVQEVADIPAEGERYSDYKQWDSRWANDKLGFSSRTIRQAGCAISSAGNIIGWTPRQINEHLKSHGGYSNGNLLIWSKVPRVPFKGWVEMSDSHFRNHHVIADLGGHFVLLTGLAGSGKYHSHDPGKNSNPVFSKSQVRSARLYGK
jgi:hypothetical protein